MYTGLEKMVSQCIIQSDTFVRSLAKVDSPISHAGPVDLGKARNAVSRSRIAKQPGLVNQSPGAPPASL